MSEDDEELECMRQLALAVVGQAITDLSSSKPGIRGGAYQFLAHSFWHPDCLWRGFLPELKRSKMLPKVQYLYKRRNK